jgi:hypothetical protein
MKYKKLIVSGCSFTENKGSWAYVLASILDIELVNLAAPGAGNKHIQYSLMNYIANNDPDPKTTLIGIMWSHPIREDIIVEFNPNLTDQSAYNYKFNDFTAEIGLKYILDNYGPNNIFNRINVAQNKTLSGNNNKAGITLNTWVTIESTISFLKNKGFDFFQTIFHDFLEKSDLISAKDRSWNFQQEYSYTQELTRINLKQNKDSWLELTHRQYLGEYAFLIKELAYDQYHPSEKGHKLWTVSVLIPTLIKQGYIEKVKLLPWLHTAEWSP